jgi:Lon protease-like protein
MIVPAIAPVVPVIASAGAYREGVEQPDEATQLIPVFPLDLVLMPGAPRRLRIFEPRYRQMLSDAQIAAERAGKDRASFGIVALRHGSETAHHQGIADIGTLGEVLRVQQDADGTSDLLLVGTRRFQILDVDTDRPYLRGRVEWLDEQLGAEQEVLHALARATQELYARYLAALTDLTGLDDDEVVAADDVALSFEIAGRIQVETAALQRLLAAPDAAHRLRACRSLLNRELTLIRSTRTVPIASTVLQIRAGPN